MSENFTNRFLSFMRRFFFEDLSPKFDVGSTKKIMDFVYIIFEKIALNFEIVYSNYIRLYEEIVEKEIEMAYVSSSDKVLVIGCGSIPATSIIIAEKTNAKTISVDKDTNAIKKASLFVKKIGLDDLMDFENKDGTTIEFRKYDVIFILYGIRQQLEMLTKIAKDMGENARVIYRTTDDALKKYIINIDNLNKMFDVVYDVESEKIYQSKSFLLRKKKKQFR